MIDEQNFFFDKPVKDNLITYDNIGDDYTTGFLSDYNYFNNYYKLIAIDLSKQQALDAHPKAIQEINFTRNLDRDGNTKMFFNTEEMKETI